MQGQGPAARLVARLAAPIQRGDRRRPGLAVTWKTFGPKMGAEGEELRKRAHRLDVPERCNAHEAMSVEIVAEQNPRVAVVGSEEAGLAVVEEITLVDRLEPDGEPVLGERGEDRLFLALGLGAQSGRPELAFLNRLNGDRLPERWIARSQGAPGLPRRCARPRPGR